MAKGLTLAALAKRVKAPRPNYLYRMRSGETTGQRYLPAIAKVLGCTVEWLTTGTGSAPSWAGAPSSDYAGALASLDAAAAIVRQVAAARKADAKEVMEGIANVRGLVEKL